MVGPSSPKKHGSVPLREVGERLASKDNSPRKQHAASDTSEDLEADTAWKPDVARSRIFPLHLCDWMPLSVRMLIPPTYQAVQDWTHLVLVFAATCSIFLLLEGMVYLAAGDGSFKDVLTLIATFPCLRFIRRTISTYDENIMVKEQAIAGRKAELTNSYESLVASIDDLLGKAAESSATMAERSFESKRRDFMRFLERADRNYGSIANTPHEVEATFLQLTNFVRRWLAVFAECSIDPINTPKVVVGEQELAACKTIGEVTNLTLERLKQTEVRFISSQRELDASTLSNLRAQAQRLKAAEHPKSFIAGALGGSSSSSSPAIVEIELAQRMPKEPAAEDSGSFEGCEGSEVGSNPPQHLQAPQDHAQETSSRCCTWLEFGTAFHCGIVRSSGSGYPCAFGLKCLRLVILSRDHAMLFLGSFMAAFLLLISVFHPDVQTTMLLTVAVYFPCLVVLLVQFEHIDIVQRLEREVSDLEAQSNRILERRERMKKFWNDMQQLTDIWVHRTVPRLDLLKEVQSLVEFAAPEDQLALMAGANSRLEALEKALPELQYWRNDSGMSEAKKKAFAERILRLCQEDSLPKIFHALNRFIEDGVPRPTISPGKAGAPPSAVEGGKPGVD